MNTPSRSKPFRVLTLCLLLSLPSCMVQTHTVGGGAAGTEVVEAKAWYLLWGLLPVHTFDSDSLAGTATSYRVTTETTFLDGLFSLLLSPLSLRMRTVRVEK